MKKSLPFLLAFFLSMAFWTTGYSPEPGYLSGTDTNQGLRDTVSQDTVDWDRPRFSARKQQRHELVNQIRLQGVKNQRVLNAMRHVPRHLFVPESRREAAYQNRPLPIGNNQTISQPFIVAYMTQLLNIQAGEKVLEIGTGSGYQAAVLSELTPHVFTIEIIEELGKTAQERFVKLGYHTINTKIGDGYQGWPAHSPFDAIIITAAAPEIPQPLIDQLKPGGVIVMPHGEPDEVQELIRITKDENGEITHEKIIPVRFVPMTGEVQKN